MIKWYDVYSEISNELLKYHKLYGAMAGEALYSECSKDKRFLSVNSWIRKFATVFKVNSIDPFHIFASFNESKLSISIRQQRIVVLFEILSKRKFDRGRIDFSGCPSPFALKIMSARKLNVQREVWHTFSEIATAPAARLSPDIDRSLKRWYGIDIDSFTIFLFWIDSLNFLSLDKNTVSFLLSTGKLESRPNSIKSYNELLQAIPKSLYRDIVEQAYVFNRGKDLKFKIPRRLFNFLRNKTITRQSGNFKIVALSVLEGTDKQFSKILTVGETYVIYKCFTFSSTGVVSYDESKDVRLYDIKEHESSTAVDISAIAGKNGTGKSSIIDLFYVAINNLTKQVLKEATDLEMVKGIFVDLYYHTDTLYKIELRGKSASLLHFRVRGNLFERPRKFPLTLGTLSSLFYTVGINYSHHALNSLELGSWIKNLFHKNDSYQAPLVINPMRTEGNIDINVENSLVKSRLLSNILEPASTNSLDNNLRVITENGRRVTSIALKIDRRKVDFLYEKEAFPPDTYLRGVIETVYKYNHIRRPKNSELTRIAEKYLFKKLVNISMRYKAYHQYLDKKSKRFKAGALQRLLDHLARDKSHITFKYRQAINFLKYRHLDRFDIDLPIEVDELSDVIQKVIEENYSENSIDVIELIPPSFFKIDLVLDDGSSFEKLSSGEKQRIHTVNSLIYHLININSVEITSDLVRYSFVNVIFDEVELYFHPEMQRTFVSYIHRYLRRVELDKLLGLNICFITHSPFILSDIPDTNILFLEFDSNTRKAKQKVFNNRTLGANIHEMLHDNFYFDQGFIGAFAKEKIKSAINFLSSYPLDQRDHNKDGWTQESVRNFIDLIAEPLIRTSLFDLYSQAFLKTVGEIDKEILRLNQLKSIVNQ